MKDSNVRLFVCGFISCSLCVLFTFFALIAFLFSTVKNDGKYLIKESATVLTDKITDCCEYIKTEAIEWKK